MEVDIIPKAFKLQWHITERCNFRCKHCYQENYDTPEMSLNEMEEVIKQFVDLVNKWEIPSQHAAISITGGEPFLYKDFFPFLARIYKYLPNCRWEILSNGSLINRENVKILKLFKISAYQVSLEGLEENNDKIRGEGSFKKAIEAIKILTGEGINTVVSLTASKENVNDILPLAELLAKIGVKRFGIRRLVPWGTGAQLMNSLLEPRELLAIYRKIEKFNEDLFKKGLSLIMPSGCENGFLWEKPTARDAYCGILVGRVLTLLPDGDVLPCRRLPIKIGNVLETPLEEIYYSDKNKEIRNPKNFPQYCRENCPGFNNCFGGARCITYAYSGRLDIPDVQCPNVYSKLGKKTLKTCLEELKDVILKYL